MHSPLATKPLQIRILSTLGLFFSLLISVQIKADEIVLRNLAVLSDVTVKKVDLDGILLNDGRQIAFDSIKDASLANQAEFDEVFEKYGDPLFRVRIRLERKDHENFGDLLSQLLPAYGNRTSASATLVQIAEFWHQIEQGKMVNAVQAHYRLYKLIILREENAKLAISLNFPIESDDGHSIWISPFDFDRKAVAESWDSIVKSYASLPTPHPSGLDYYFFVMAQINESTVAAELKPARLNLTGAEKRALIAQQVLMKVSVDEPSVQGEIGTLLRSFKMDTTQAQSPIQKAIGLYFRGKLELISDANPKSDGLLSLLRIHAEIGEATPAISAAALADVERFLRNKLPANDAKSVSKELLSRYPSSIFAKRFRMAKRK